VDVDVPLSTTATSPGPLVLTWVLASIATIQPVLLPSAAGLIAALSW